MKDKRIVIAGLLSAKINFEEYLDQYYTYVIQNSGVVVGKLIQRRGVSKSSKKNRQLDMNKPLNSNTYIGPGKVQELKELVMIQECDLVLFINKLSTSQINRISEVIGVEVIIKYF